MSGLWTILTAAGARQVAETGRLAIAAVAYGDGAYAPALDADGYATQTALVSEKGRQLRPGFRTAPASAAVDIFCVIGALDGFWLREVGLLDARERLLAVHSRPGSVLAWIAGGMQALRQEWTFTLTTGPEPARAPEPETPLGLRAARLNDTDLALFAADAFAIQHWARRNGLKKEAQVAETVKALRARIDGTSQTEATP